MGISGMAFELRVFENRCALQNCILITLIFSGRKDYCFIEPDYGFVELCCHIKLKFCVESKKPNWIFY